ncbi:hypothetical protein E5N72_03695 [Pseudoalteromonas sp. MEBiC 03607]|jgi:hypothetical protein|uniref:hypothetical protein n=1 Tax=Pseudoalteromonas TaxID=53246 RepID=UPI000C63D661|nr:MULTISPECIES: hypothetical protein [unclassified Pseudoalteromonas]MBD56019.1 hypothetical protein [Pseudoalteromonas sp.]MBU76529.1 hypothetical protein [Pseudoalteromonadaceae bacterium]MCF2922089.1 hypothetical protein [Pseudoalteromonas sp. APAL1]TGV19222.1 hypothetical protein E5N72_03695 [Pseudoalteromonas sp. MEBiC 03607]TMO47385.1 hypothetical protein CWC25_01470 [Pseudoalteromonas sp. S4389]|tara:strand:+ start:523 stop:909 length:387 start_codon:yes stop_codon:yes gene_type:complete
MKKIAWLLLALLAGCASQEEAPPFEINNKQFYEKNDDQGNKIFAYVVSVKAQGRRPINLDKPMTRSQFKDFAEQEVFEESSNLKLMLEDQAVELLNEELKARQYCDDKHIIDEVLWRDLSVQLRGRCL